MGIIRAIVAYAVPPPVTWSLSRAIRSDTAASRWSKTKLPSLTPTHWPSSSTSRSLPLWQ
ncbi:hypothetical protein SFUMM280S_07085 [Streptomyces fumanus]